MKKRILTAVLVTLLLALVCAAAGAAASPAKLEPAWREDTWYTRLPTGFPDEGGAYSTEMFAQMWSPEAVRDYSDTNLSWNLIHVSGPDNFVLFYEPNSDRFGKDWMDRFFCAYVKPKSGTLTVGTSVYRMTADYKGVTYEGDLTIHTVNSAVPESATVRAYKTDGTGSYIGAEIPFTNGTLTVKTGESCYLSGMFDNYALPVEKQWINSWFDNGADRMDRWTGASTGTIDRSNTEYFTATNPGIYHVGTTISQEYSNLEVYVPFTLAVADANGIVPMPEMKNFDVFPNERNIYLGLEHYGNGLGADLIGVWGETGWIGGTFSGYEELQQVYGGEPQWTIQRNGQTIYTGGGYADGDWGVLEYQILEPENQAGDVVYTVSCEWGDQKKTETVVFHYISLQTVPTGHSYPETVSLSVGDQLIIDPTVEPAGAVIPGYDYRVYLFNEQMEEFATLVQNASTSKKKVYRIDNAGVFNATILLQADTVSIGKETIFRIADANGDVPTPEIRMNSWNGMERNFWRVPGVTPGGSEYGKLQSDDFVDQIYIENTSACRHELGGDPVWSVSDTTYFGLRKADGDGAELYLKKMPASARDLTVNITCAWGGQTAAVPYTVHFLNAPDGLPQAVFMKPNTYIRVMRTGTPFNYNFGFRNFSQIEGTGCYQDLSDSLRSAVGGWDEVCGAPGIYEGYVETGFDNVFWREKYTLVITEADGTMNVNDYQNFGTVQKLPDSLTVIGREAFAGTKMTEVDIPAGVVTIEDYAFDGSGLVGIYTHNNPAAVQYATSNGYVAIVE